MRAFSIGIALSLFFANAVVAQSVEDLQSKFEECFKSKDYDCAESAMLKLIKKDKNSDHANYYNNLGTVQLRLGKKQEALKSYSTAINIRPNVPLYLDNRGNLKKQLGDLEGALADLNKALEIDPKNENALTHRATVLEKLGKPDEARRDLETYLKDHPDDFQVASNLALIKKRQGLMEEALEDFNRLVAQHPNESVLLNNRADTKMKLNMLEGALEDINLSLKADPNYTNGYVTKGEILLAMGKNDEACEFFKIGIEKGTPKSIVAKLAPNCNL